MGKIRLNDGTEYDGSAVDDENILWLDLSGVSLQDCYTDLMDAEKMSHIIAYQYGIEYEYNGYSHAFSLRETNGTKVSVGLLRPDEN